MYSVRQQKAMLAWTALGDAHPERGNFGSVASTYFALPTFKAEQLNQEGHATATGWTKRGLPHGYVRCPHESACPPSITDAAVSGV